MVFPRGGMDSSSSSGQESQFKSINEVLERSLPLISYSRRNVTVRSHEVCGILLETGIVCLLAPRKLVRGEASLPSRRCNVSPDVPVDVELPVERAEWDEV